MNPSSLDLYFSREYGPSRLLIFLFGFSFDAFSCIQIEACFCCRIASLSNSIATSIKHQTEMFFLE